MLPALARNNLVYAIDRPGYDGSVEPPDYTPAFTSRFVSAFLDAVGVEHTVVVGNSFGGLAALHLALSEPERVFALVLANSGGLDPAVNQMLLALTLFGWGELVPAWDRTPLGALHKEFVGKLLAAWDRTPPGAAHRAFRRAWLLFARPWQIPIQWLTGQYKVAQVPSFTETSRAALSDVVDLMGQREVFLDQLPHLQMPTLIVWGTEDKLFPYWQAIDAASRLKKGTLRLIPSCGHLPHVEQPERFVSILSEFVGSLR